MKTIYKVWLGLGVGVCLVVVGAVFFLLGILKINVPSAERYPVRGVDVSEYQGEITWESIERQGMEFAFIKATEGSGYVDPYFDSNWANIGATAMLYGAYHFFSFESSGQTQAENFCSAVDFQEGMLPPVVDIELYGAYKKSHPEADDVRGELDVLLARLEEHYGVKPILYVTQQSYSMFIRGVYAAYPIWIREVYFVPRLPSGEEWVFWQYTGKGRLDGYRGTEKYIDMNVFAGTAEELALLCVGN